MDSTLELFIDNIKYHLRTDSFIGINKIQSLWSDYGGIFRLALKDSNVPSVVVKCITRAQKETHPRGWATNLSHQRKLKSYEVETCWYEQYASSLPEHTKVPQLLYSEHRVHAQVLVLEDLSPRYPGTTNKCTYAEAKSVVQWLARFHAHFLNAPAKGLWPIGSYWHLDTRPDEWQAMEDSSLKRNAQQLNDVLNTARFSTIIHGDAKVANFCFADDGTVAAVDFQYVGKGVGVKDLAYFMGSCFSDEECQLYENALLDAYFVELTGSLGDANKSFCEDLESEWRQLYPIAWADFNRFLLGWKPGHSKLHTHALSKNDEAFEVLNKLTQA